ncbi:hypothetical protein SAMN05216191_10596 [Paenibacillus jilunlii]|uniref:Uncharacterized protein n=1 Tax=Paenibacillus jilunlii TaxID=682956 RepID=A0A1G9MCP8_9BACL|nr:hypothetical protein SAMN05216191_10596 [Paenibacillus jilunlii]
MYSVDLFLYKACLHQTTEMDCPGRSPCPGRIGLALIRQPQPALFYYTDNPAAPSFAGQGRRVGYGQDGRAFAGQGRRVGYTRWLSLRWTGRRVGYTRRRRLRWAGAPGWILKTAAPSFIGRCNRLGFQSGVTWSTTPHNPKATPSGKSITNLLAHPISTELGGKRYTNLAHFDPTEGIWPN